MLESIVDYSDSDEEETETDNVLQSDTEKLNPLHKKQQHGNHFVKESKKKQALPLPSSINNLFKDNRTSADDKHKGRKRTFEHVEGNWATFVFIPPVVNTNLSLLYNGIEVILKKEVKSPKLHLISLNDCHLTLSRTVPVRHYWMDTIFKMLKDKFSIKKKFFYSLTGLEVYTNDDESRTFVSLKILTNSYLLDFVSTVDDVFGEFKLPAYYTEPSFHLSIAWCLGNQKEKLSEVIQNQAIQDLFLNLNSQLGMNFAERVCVKFGHKLQQIELA